MYTDDEKWVYNPKYANIDILILLKETKLFLNNKDIAIIIKLIAIDCLMAQKERYVKNGNNNEEIIMAADFLKVFARL